MTNDRLEHYMRLRYPMELIEDDGGFVAEHPDLPGCFAQGESADEAVAALGVSRRLWIEGRLEQGLAIPEPTASEDYSGRFVVRIARSTHAELARRAAREAVSLNHYVSTVFSRHLGAAPLQEFVQGMTRRLEEILADLQVAAKRSSGQVSTAYMVDVPNANSFVAIWSEMAKASSDVQMVFARPSEQKNAWKDDFLPTPMRQFRRPTTRRLPMESE